MLKCYLSNRQWIYASTFIDVIFDWARFVVASDGVALLGEPIVELLAFLADAVAWSRVFLYSTADNDVVVVMVVA